MFRVPGKYPRAATLHIETRAPRLNPLQSRKGRFLIVCGDGASINNYNIANPGNEASVVIADAFQILPYSTLQIVAMAAPPAATPYLAPVTIDPGMNATAVATAVNAGIVAWINAYKVQNTDVDSMTSVQKLDPNLHVLTNDVRVQLPWGIDGAPDITTVGPFAFTSEATGFDNPLNAGIVGPRFHIFPIRPRYDGGYYYGDVNIG